MTENIAMCGLNCDECRAYIATKTKDRRLAGEIAKLWSNTIEGTYTADDIWCDGCHSNKLHGWCLRCPVRLCAKEKEFAHCGTCDEYPCKKLKDLYSMWVESDPAKARANLDRLRERFASAY